MNMTTEQALAILVQAARIGQARGAYSLEDAAHIANAISLFAPKQDKNVLTGNTDEIAKADATEETSKLTKKTKEKSTS